MHYPLVVCLAAALPACQAQYHEHPIEKATVAGHFEMVPQLLQALRSGAAADRARGAFLLGQIGDPQAADALARLLRHEDRSVRMHAGMALCMLRDARGLAACRAALTDSPLWMRYYAASGLAALHSEEALRALRAGLAEQAEFIAQHIGHLLASEAPERPQPVLVEDPEEVQQLSSEDVFYWGADAYVVRADIFWHGGDYDQAVRCNESAVFLDPGWVDIYDNSRWLLWSMGRNREAIEVGERAIQHNPDNWMAYHNLGYHYFNIKEYAQAVPLLKRSVELGAPMLPQHTYCHALEKNGAPAAALREWQRVLRDFPADPIAPRQIERLTPMLQGQ